MKISNRVQNLIESKDEKELTKLLLDYFKQNEPKGKHTNRYQFDMVKFKKYLEVLDYAPGEELAIGIKNFNKAPDSGTPGVLYPADTFSNDYLQVEARAIKKVERYLQKKYNTKVIIDGPYEKDWPGKGSKRFYNIMIGDDL